MTDLKSALMELTDRICPKGEQPLKRGAAIVETAMLIIELEPPLCSDCGDNHGGATGCFPSQSKGWNNLSRREKVKIYLEAFSRCLKLTTNSEKDLVETYTYHIMYDTESPSEKDGNKPSKERGRVISIKEAREIAFKMSETAEEELKKEREEEAKRMRCTECEEMHKEIESLKIQTEIAQEQSTGWMEKNEKLKKDFCVMREGFLKIEGSYEGEDENAYALVIAKEVLSRVSNYSPKA